VSLIGRHCILRDDGEPWVQTSAVGVERLRTFWDWALDHIDYVSVLTSFGYWMKAGLFEDKWLASRIRRTLGKTNGAVEWQHGMMETLRALAAVSPEDVVEALRSHLYTGRVTDPSARGWVHVDDNLVETFKVLCANDSTDESARRLINDLLPLGNGRFWRLKEALQE
jgi:hypothetical protein